MHNKPSLAALCRYHQLKSVPTVKRPALLAPQLADMHQECQRNEIKTEGRQIVKEDAKREAGSFHLQRVSINILVVSCIGALAKRLRWARDARRYTYL